MQIARVLLEKSVVFYDIDNPNGSNNFFTFKPYDSNTIFNLNCPSSQKLLAKSNFNSSRQWILLGNDFNESISQISKLDINIDTKMLLIVVEEELIYRIWSASLSRGAVLHIEKLGNIFDENLKIPAASNDLEAITVFAVISVSKSVAFF